MERILGHGRAINALQQSLQSRRVHHAWIFSGPKGVGKFTTTIEFARILLDPDAQSNLAGVIESPPGSESSKLIDAESHPDLHIIRKELALYSSNAALRNRKLTNIPLDLLRETMIGGRTNDDKVHEAPAYRTAARNHGKVFIIDEAELLEPIAQNALLKTLEEPPTNTYMILVTDRPDRLLQTIRSRCQHVRFGLLDQETMAQWFNRQSYEDIDPQTRDWVLTFADGSPGVAQLALEYDFHEWMLTLHPMLRDLAEGRFPSGMGETLAKYVDDFANAWVKKHDNASKDAANKAGAGHVLNLLAGYARQAIQQRLRSELEADFWLAAVDVLHQTEEALRANVNMKMAFEDLVAQLALQQQGAAA